ncbi:MAG: hypothetical protein ACRC62_22145 [Microcoleus sp.]
MSRLYQYVGSNDIRLAVAKFPAGTKIESVSQLENWIAKNSTKLKDFSSIAATFVVDLKGYLCIADRHSEHIACAGGDPVLSAGEIFFECTKRGWEVVEITNQSTGFCPEPESWLQVAESLDLIPIPHPGKFTIEFVFRRCTACSQLNVIKDNLFICSVCNTELPDVWNCERY